MAECQFLYKTKKNVLYVFTLKHTLISHRQTDFSSIAVKVFTIIPESLIHSEELFLSLLSHFVSLFQVIFVTTCQLHSLHTVGNCFHSGVTS